MSNTNETALYVLGFTVLFCMVLSYLTFLRFESENIKKEGLNFTLIGALCFIFRPLRFFWSFLRETLFLIENLFSAEVIKKTAKNIASPISLFKILIFPFKFIGVFFWRVIFILPFEFINVVFWWGVLILKKIMCYEWRLPIHWNFGNLVLTFFVLIFFVLYGGYFWSLIYKVDIFLILSLFFVLTFFSLATFVLQYVYKKMKYIFYFFVFLNVVTITLSPYFTSDFFSYYSDVSPEKVTRLLYFINVVAYVFCFYLLFYVVYCFFFICLIFLKFYFFLYARFDFFVERPKPNPIRDLCTGNWFVVLMILCFLSVPFAVFGKILGSPSYRFEQIMSEYMFTDNNGRCHDLNSKDKIYFYEQGRVLQYIPKKEDQDEEEYRVKYIDYQCKNKSKNESNENKLKENQLKETTQ